MPLTLCLLDETTDGERHSAGEFRFDIAALTLREIIRFRVQQEVERFNQYGSEVFQGLIRPEESERGFLDWEQQYIKAVTAFKGNGFLVFVDGIQVNNLEETIQLTAETKVRFLKLVPLMGCRG